MRLTLRTLLAHLDQVLDPSEAEVMESKIKNSSHATELIERIRECSKTKHLGTPPLSGKGLGGDPNTVAEYLDNTLPAQRIPEFEVICMQSDIQLAEVAACHQILAHALGNPAAVTVELRNRIAKVGKEGVSTRGTVERTGGGFARIDPAHRAESQVKNAEQTHREDEQDRSEVRGSKSKIASVPQATPLAENHRVAKQPETIREQGIDLSDDRALDRVPDYLRGGSSIGWKQMAMTAVLVILLVVVGWQTLGSFSNIRQMLAGKPKGDAQFANSKSGIDRDTSAAGQGQSSANVDSGAVESGSGRELSANNANIDNSKLPSNEVNEKDSGDTNAATTSDESGEGAKDVANSNPSIPTIPANGGPNSLLPNIAQPVAQWLPETSSSGESLMMLMGKDGSVRRLAIGEKLGASSHLIVPPAYRTELQVQPGLRWTVAGATDIEFHDKDAGGVAQIQLHRVRAIIHAGQNAQRLKLLWDNRAIELNFTEPNGVAAVELRHFITPGTSLAGANPIDPSLIRSVFQVISIRGTTPTECTLFEEGQAFGPAVPLSVGQVLGWVELERPVSFELTQEPRWLRSSIDRPIEARAILDLHRLTSSTPPDQLLAQLTELTLDRRPETASMAARTLCMLGDFQTLIGKNSLFLKPSLRAYWNSIIEDWRASIGHSERSMNELRNRWMETDPSNAATLEELLIGYSPEQLTQGADRKLNDALSSPSMEYRALAAYQLRQLFDSDLEYLADRPLPESLQNIRRLLTTGKLNYVRPPVPLPEWSPIKN